MKRLIILLIILVISSCGNCVTKSIEISPKEERERIIVTTYKVDGTNRSTCVEKFVIEGHEYLVFGSKLANPPTVIHSESCPCK